MQAFSSLPAEILRNAVAAPSDRNADAERHVHRSRSDGQELRRMAANQHIGRQEEVDPTGTGIDRHAEGVPLAVEKRIAGGQRKPGNRVEVHRNRTRDREPHRR